MTALGVSIVIPTYRRGASLGRILVALERQTVTPTEILVIDQNVPGWLEAEVGDALSGSRVLWMERANASAARNLGFVESRGELVLFVDDDLVPEPDFLARAIERMQALPDVGCLCPLLVDPSSASAGTRDAPAMALRSHPRAPEVLSMGSVMSAAMVFRRDTYQRSGGFDELLFDYARAGEDQELCFRMRARGLDVWLDTALPIVHDEGVPGGCELRTRPFWESRERAIRSNVLRARLHARGRIELRPFVRLVRTAFLNTNMLRSPPASTLKNAALLVEAVFDSRRLLQRRGSVIPELGAVDHLAPHRERASDRTRYRSPRNVP